MKKELVNLLAQDWARLEINDMFYLERSRESKENNILGCEIDALRLYINNRYKASVDIISRTTEGIQQEVEAGMEKLLDEYKEDMKRRWRGGLL